jgi:hypothetical protein
VKAKRTARQTLYINRLPNICIPTPTGSAHLYAIFLAGTIQQTGDTETNERNSRERLTVWSGPQINPDKAIANNKPPVDRVTIDLLVFRSLVISSAAPRREVDDTLAQTVHQPAKEVIALFFQRGVVYKLETLLLIVVMASGAMSSKLIPSTSKSCGVRLRKIERSGLTRFGAGLAGLLVGAGRGGPASLSDS